MANIDLKSATTNELGVMGAAFVAFVGLFFHAYGASYKGGDALGFNFSAHLSGWHFAGLWLPTFLVILAAALVGVRRFRGDLIPSTLPVGTRVVVAGACGLALLIAVIRALTYPGGGGGVSAGASFGTYLVVLAIVAATVFAVLDLRASGEKLPTLPSKPSSSDTSV